MSFSLLPCRHFTNFYTGTNEHRINSIQTKPFYKRASQYAIAEGYLFKGGQAMFITPNWNMPRGVGDWTTGEVYDIARIDNLHDVRVMEDDRVYHLKCDDSKMMGVVATPEQMASALVVEEMSEYSIIRTHLIGDSDRADIELLDNHFYVVREKYKVGDSDFGYRPYFMDGKLVIKIGEL